LPSCINNHEFLEGGTPPRRFVNITQLVIDDLSAAPFGCYRRTTSRSWKNLRALAYRWRSGERPAGL